MGAGNGHTKDWRDIRIDVSRAEAAAVGKLHGVTPAEFRGIEQRVLTEHRIMRRERNAKKYGFYDLYKDEKPFALVKRTAKRFIGNAYDNLVILGIGGSALGITALNTALNPPYYNLLSRARRSARPRLFVMDNIDPVTFQAMLRICKPEKTLFNVVSKSGGTAETILQLMVVVDMLEKALGKQALKRHIVVTTSPKGVKGVPKSLLHPVADAYGLTRLPIPVNVGGRFSVFTPVGMFPAAMLGMDIEAMRAGCAAMDVRCSTSSLHDNPAYLRAVVQYLMNTMKGKSMSVMMPYVDALRDVADWYRQLWAESLGKRFDLKRTKELFTGQTPIRALGATDQHS